MRLMDADNYYVGRANALEDNVNLYRVVKGRRKQMAGASAKVSSGMWHTLTLRVEGDRLSVSFNGKPLLTHSDRTFAGPGKVALWTKADSVTHFDRLEIRPLHQTVGTTKTQETHMVRTTLKAAALCIMLPAAAGAAEADWTKVADALGKSGAEMAGGVYRVGLPRTDLHVKLDGVDIKPTLALGSWLAFKGKGDATMVMGDLVLTEDEVGPVMKKLTENGIEITALHNHLLRAQPATLYMHVLGHGDPAKLATALHDGLVLSKTPIGNATASANSQAPTPVASSSQAPAAGSEQPGRTGSSTAAGGSQAPIPGSEQPARTGPATVATSSQAPAAGSEQPARNTPNTVATSSQSPAAGSEEPARLDLDTVMIDRTLGAHGKAVGGVYQVGVPRAETIYDNGMEVPIAMGSAEAINFQPTGGGKAAITGDFVLTAKEVNPVLHALRENGIEVTAVHNHMLDDEPRLFFMHFWANDDAAKLAKGLRAALDQVNVARS